MAYLGILRQRRKELLKEAARYDACLNVVFRKLVDEGKSVEEAMRLLQKPDDRTTQLMGHERSILLRYDRKYVVERAVKPPAFASIDAFTDWVPSPATRKLLKKFTADQQVHVDCLSAHGRKWVVRWTVLCTWVLMIWYVVLHAISSASKAIKGKMAG